MVVNGKETVLEGCFITEETYDQYQSIKSNVSVEVLKEDKKDENRYFFYKCEGSGGTEYDYVLWIEGSHTGILMGGLEGQEAAESHLREILLVRIQRKMKGVHKMQLEVYIELEEKLVLPINYNHIVQSIIYKALSIMPDYADFLHESGYLRGNRQYKMFQFSQLNGNYKIHSKQIIFDSYVMLEIRSPEPLLMNLLVESFYKNGITFGQFTYRNIRMELYDYTVEENELIIQMKSPLTVYSTDRLTGKTYFYNPDESKFYEAIRQNFDRKYQAYFGVEPYSSIQIYKSDKDFSKKFVTKYQGNFITAWFGTFHLSGERKYLDFLYQTGLGAKNAQGFGMFGCL